MVKRDNSYRRPYRHTTPKNRKFHKNVNHSPGDRGNTTRKEIEKGYKAFDANLETLVMLNAFRWWVAV